MSRFLMVGIVLMTFSLSACCAVRATKKAVNTTKSAVRTTKNVVNKTASVGKTAVTVVALAAVLP